MTDAQPEVNIYSWKSNLGRHEPTSYMGKLPSRGLHTLPNYREGSVSNAMHCCSTNGEKWEQHK